MSGTINHFVVVLAESNNTITLTIDLHRNPGDVYVFHLLSSHGAILGGNNETVGGQHRRRAAFSSLHGARNATNTSIHTLDWGIIGDHEHTCHLRVPLEEWDQVRQMHDGELMTMSVIHIPKTRSDISADIHHFPRHYGRCHIIKDEKPAHFFPFGINAVVYNLPDGHAL